jgi:hypothetical protein
VTVIVPVERPRRVPEMDLSDIHCNLDAPPHVWCERTCRALWIAAVRKLAADAIAESKAWQRTQIDAFMTRFRAELFGRSAVEKLRLRCRLDAILFGLEPQGLDAAAMDCHLQAWNDRARSEWLDKMCGTPHWRAAGIGIARADCRADGFWDFWPDADVLGPKSGTAVLTIPEFDGDAVVEIFAIEIAPSASQRRVGRVFRHTGNAIGLGIDTFEALEWRHNSTRLALVASPLDWVKRFAVAPETGSVTPLLDGQPCSWLLGLDEAQGLAVADAGEQMRIDDMLCAADPILIDGTDPSFAFCVQAALDRARRRRMPPKPELLLWTPDREDHANKEHASRENAA